MEFVYQLCQGVYSLSTDQINISTLTGNFYLVILIYDILLFIELYVPQIGRETEFVNVCS